MRLLIAIAALVASVCAIASDGAWLIYDLKYKEYFLLRIDMKTSRTGEATVAGNNRFAGKRRMMMQKNKKTFLLCDDDYKAIMEEQIRRSSIQYTVSQCDDETEV